MEVLKQVPVKPSLNRIDFKELTPKDFYDAYNVKNNKVSKVAANSHGSITESLLNEIDITEKNTVVVNAGVGQGKSTACIQIAKKYFDIENPNNGDKSYTVIFAAPFKSILQQYETLLRKIGISETEIFHYENMNEANYKLRSTSPIHLITVNTLLGNYGEEGFMQANLKRKYLDEIIRACTKRKRKVVIIFDEIHDSIASFKQKFIFNLWKWHNLIHKNIVLSATFSEASKVVVKYLADLTDDNIHLIQSVRIKKAEKQSKLHLCFNNNPKYTADDDFLEALILEESRKKDHIQILCFTKTLAKDILRHTLEKGKREKSKVGKLLSNKFKNIQLCTSETPSIFDDNKCNVGTNFTTGVNIETINTSYIIILPDLRTYSNENIFNKRNLGVFTNGYISLVQALARLRKGTNNDIFIVLPTPPRLIANISGTSGWSNYLNRVGKIYQLRKLKLENKLSEYFGVDEQDKLLRKFYQSGVFSLSKAFENMNYLNIVVKERDIKKPRLEYPTYEEFVMEDGERFLATSQDVFGKDMSSYIIWAAFNNQFENTTLKSVIIKDKIIIKQGEFISKILWVYNKYIKPLTDIDWVSEKALFDMLYDFMITKLDIVVKTDKVRELSKNKEFVKALIAVVKLIKRPTNSFINVIYPNGRDNPPQDYFVTKDMYLRAALGTIHSNMYQDGENKFSIDHSLEGYEKLLEAIYQRLYVLVKYFKENFVFRTVENVDYIPKKDFLIEQIVPIDKQIKAIQIIKDLRATDLLIKNDTFSFCQWADKVVIDSVRENIDSVRKAFGKIVDELRGILYESEPISISPGNTLTNQVGFSINIRNSQPYLIKKEFDITTHALGVNVIYKSSIPFKESIVSDKFEENWERNTQNGEVEAIL